MIYPFIGPKGGEYAFREWTISPADFAGSSRDFPILLGHRRVVPIGIGITGGPNITGSGTITFDYRTCHRLSGSFPAWDTAQEWGTPANPQAQLANNVTGLNVVAGGGAGNNILASLGVNSQEAQTQASSMGQFFVLRCEVPAGVTGGDLQLVVVA